MHSQECEQDSECQRDKSAGQKILARLEKVDWSLLHEVRCPDLITHQKECEQTRLAGTPEWILST